MILIHTVIEERLDQADAVLHRCSAGGGWVPCGLVRVRSALRRKGRCIRFAFRKGTRSEFAKMWRVLLPFPKR